MNWFKTLWLNSEEREILKAAKEKKDFPVIEPVVVKPEPQIEISTKPYKNIFYSNGNLTVVFKDGTMISKSDVNQDIFVSIRDSDSQNHIENLLVQKIVEPVTAPKQEFETKEERDLVSDNLEVFSGNPDFEVKGKDVFLKGVNLAMPASVIASFIELLEKRDAQKETAQTKGEYFPGAWQSLDEQLEALKMFWLKLALNTLPQSREDLLTFVRRNDVRITGNGNLVLYRRIVSKDGADQKLVTFVSQEYYRIKKSGLDTRNFAIAKNVDDYELVDLEKYDGTGNVPFVNLQVAYLELPTYESNTFTAWHDPKVDIKIGGIYKIPEKGINLNNGLCAAGGLHAAAVDYNYSGFGDLPVVVLVNPSKAITVPINETGKLRTTEMFIACVNDKEHGKHFDESALGVFDEEYHDLSLTELEEAAKTKSFEKLSILDTVPAVSLVDLNTIKQMLQKRVKTVI